MRSQRGLLLWRSVVIVGRLITVWLVIGWLSLATAQTPEDE